MNAGAIGALTIVILTAVALGAMVATATNHLGYETWSVPVAFLTAAATVFALAAIIGGGF
jgi:hypothetical protein